MKGLSLSTSNSSSLSGKDGHILDLIENMMLSAESKIAIKYCDDIGNKEEVSYQDLYRRVSRFAEILKK